MFFLYLVSAQKHPNDSSDGLQIPSSITLSVLQSLASVGQINKHIEKCIKHIGKYIANRKISI